MRFCQRELGEKPTRSGKRKSSAAPKPVAVANGMRRRPLQLPKAAQAVFLDNLLSAVPANLSAQANR